MNRFTKLGKALCMFAIPCVRDFGFGECADTAPPRKKHPPLISYGDGKADGKKSFGGNGEMIRFELPEGVTKVRGIKIHGSRYGLPKAPDEDFEITFLNDNLDEILLTETAPLSTLQTRSRNCGSASISTSPSNSPKLSGSRLNFNAQQTNGVYVSYDTSTKGEHSRVGLAGSEEAPTPTDFNGDWMVQVLLAK